MNLAVRYKNGAQLSYSLTAYSPWEGYRIAFNGTKGRLELDERKVPTSAPEQPVADGLSSRANHLIVFPHWEKPWNVEIPEAVGGHGGGDLLLLEDLFGSAKRKMSLHGRPAIWMGRVRFSPASPPINLLPLASRCKLISF